MPEPDDTQTREPSGAEKRGSPRILRKVLLRIDYGTSFTTAHSAVINLGGALIVCRVRFETDAPLQVTNLQTGVRAPFRVVWCSDPEEGRYRLGMELREELDFWGDAYNPGPGD